MVHLTEWQRIAAAERDAKTLVAQLPEETVEKFGAGQLISDLTQEFLMSSRPSQELAEQLKAQLLTKGAPTIPPQ